MQGLQNLFATEVITAKTIRDAWEETLKYVNKVGTIVTVPYGTELRKIKEVMSLTTIVVGPTEEMNILKYLPKNVQLSIEKEVHGKQRLALLLEALTNPEVHPEVNFRSGERLWRWERTTFCQIDDVAETLNKAPLTFRAMMTSINPLSDFKNRYLYGYDFPIYVGIHFIYREKLNLITVLRHINVYTWWLINAIQLSKLLEFMAHKTNLGAGTLTMFSSSAYIREEHFEEVNKLLKAHQKA